MLGVAVGSGVIFTKFKLRQLISAWIIAFFDADILCHVVTLTITVNSQLTMSDHPLILKVCGTSSIMWSKSVRNLSKIEQFPAELLIILRIFAHVMSCCDLDLWAIDLELLQHFGCHVFIKFGWNWIIHGWSIDNLAHIRCSILGGGALLTEGFQGCVKPTSPNLAKT